MLKVGTIVRISENIEEAFNKVKGLGMNTCQISSTAEFVVNKLNPKKIKEGIEKSKIEVDAIFLLFENQIFDRYKGPPTMGFVPEEYRQKRLELAKKFSDWVAETGIKTILSHVGFIPDDPQDPLYKGFLPVMKEVIQHCKKNNQMFRFETGQELPSTLLRTIKDLGKDNVGINLDTGNLILYGMAHPLDAVEIFGEYVQSLHAKDALWPNRDEGLGIEVPVGEGVVNFPLLMPALKRKGFKGAIIIEREISGEQQIKDILKAKKFLEPYL